MPHAAPNPTPLIWRLGIGAAILLLRSAAWFSRDTIGVRGQAVAGVFYSFPPIKQHLR